MAFEQSRAGDLIVFGAGEDLFEPFRFVGVLGDEQLTAFPVGHSGLGHIGDEQLEASPGELRFRRPGPLVESGVDDSGGVSALMCSDVLGFVEDGDLDLGEPRGDFAGGGDTEDTGTDDGHS